MQAQSGDVDDEEIGYLLGYGVHRLVQDFSEEVPSTTRIGGILATSLAGAIEDRFERTPAMARIGDMIGYAVRQLLECASADPTTLCERFPEFDGMLGVAPWSPAEHNDDGATRKYPYPKDWQTGQIVGTVVGRILAHISENEGHSIPNYSQVNDMLRHAVRHVLDHQPDRHIRPIPSTREIRHLKQHAVQELMELLEMDFDIINVGQVIHELTLDLGEINRSQHCERC